MRYLIFFGVVFVLDFLMHFYVGRRFTALISAEWRPFAWVVLGLMGVLLIVAPIATRLEWPGAHALAVLGFSWMGILWLLFVACLAGDLLAVANAILKWMGQSVLDSWVNPVRMVLFGLAILGAGFGAKSALSLPPLVEKKVVIPNLPAEFESYKILQLSDTHIGPILGRSWMEAVVRQAQLAGADLVVHTGDLVDGSVRQHGESIRPLQSLRGKDGALFVTGNHEVYSGAIEWSKFMASLGWNVLENQHVQIQRGNSILVVAGVTDYSEGAHQNTRASNPSRALAGSPADAIKILLAHQPKSALDAQELAVQLQLSGHTHGGQIWPFNFLVYLQQPMNVGLQMVGKVLVHTSKGTGFWGPPMRLFASPEIPVLVLSRQ